MWSRHRCWPRQTRPIPPHHHSHTPLHSTPTHSTHTTSPPPNRYSTIDQVHLLSREGPWRGYQLALRRAYPNGEARRNANSKGKRAWRKEGEGICWCENDGEGRSTAQEPRPTAVLHPDSVVPQQALEPHQELRERERERERERGRERERERVACVPSGPSLINVPFRALMICSRTFSDWSIIEL